MFALGKLPAKPDPRRLALTDYLDLAAVPAVPSSFLLNRLVPNWPYYGNDTIGDCVPAALGHMIQAWTANAGDPFTPTDAEIIGAYSAIAGYVPGNPSTDHGTYSLSALDYFVKTGIAGHRLAVYAEVSRNPKHLSMATYLYGGCALGLNLPLSAQALTRAGKRWEVDETANGVPGTWGGHYVNLIAYDPWSCCCATWGRLQWMSWDFVAKYGDEAQALFSADMFNGKFTAPNGVDVMTLGADLGRLIGS